MNNLLMEKLDELFSELDNCKEVKEMLKLKEEIYKDNELKELLNDYRKISNRHDSKTIEIKNKIIENPLIKKYRILENELYFTVLEMNNRLGALFGNKRCNNARN